LYHDFVIRNPSRRPLRLTAVEAFTPCCSAVGPVPPEVAPGGLAKIPLMLKPGHQTGRKRAMFAVRTDSAKLPSLSFALNASLFAECETRVLEGSDVSVPIGRGARQILEITCRRKGREGLPLPESIRAVHPLKIESEGEAREKVSGGDFVEATRRVVVAIPQTHEPGVHRSEVAFRWKDGREFNRDVGWRVEPAIRATPAGIVIQSSPGSVVKLIHLRADRPFRILKVSGPLIDQGGALDVATAVMHTVELPIRTSASASSSASDIRIETDHPDQQSVLVSVMILPAK
jgi:hypothetical protein